MKLTILQGPPAAGKSTWVREYLSKLSEDERKKVVVVSRDAIRESTGTYWVPEREQYITRLEDTAMKAALLNGLDVINDATNLNPKTIEHLKDIAAQCGAEVDFVPLYVSFKTALERDKKRERSLGRKVIEGFYKRYYKERFEYEEYTDKRHLRPLIQGNESAVICDLDGTVALHTSGRSPYDYDRCDEDTPCAPTVETLRRLADSGVRIIFVTGREDSCEEKTRAWICNYVMDTRPYELFMRKTGDRRSGDVLKKEIYYKKVSPKYNVIHVFEDSTKCVKMYRELGLQCSQVYDFEMSLDNNYDENNL